MGKGSNVQKKQAAQLRNQKDKSKTDEERKAAAEKAKKDAAAFICAICRQTFMVNSKPPQLYQHVLSKHEGSSPTECFPVELKNYDPNDPKDEKKSTGSGAAAAAPVKPKKAPTKDAGLDDLLNAGLSSTKKGKK